VTAEPIRVAGRTNLKSKSGVHARVRVNPRSRHEISAPQILAYCNIQDFGAPR
jgi:hypothetical protein